MDIAKTPFGDHLPRLLASLGPEAALSGMPDGVVARSIQKVRRDGAGWRQVHDRRRRLRLNLVLLGQTPDAGDYEVDFGSAYTEGERNFVLNASRRSWQAITDRFGTRATTTAIDLVQRGVVFLECQVTDGLALGEPMRWHLTERGATAAAARAQTVTAARHEIESRRSTVLAGLGARIEQARHQDGHLSTESVSVDAMQLLAAALETARGSATLPVLIAATEDLLVNTRHASPRDFSLVHFEHSKERDDAADLLADAGVPDEVIAALGLFRSPRIGVAGAINAMVGNQTIQLSLLDGPVLIRSDQPDLRLVTHTAELIIVENLQAAETLANTADEPPLCALVYTAGQPASSARRLITSLCTQASRTLLCPDADLGGVRIAAAILRELSDQTANRVTLCDIGAWPHKPQSPWPEHGYTASGLTEALTGEATQLARACLARGYRVEQEHAIRLAVQHWRRTGSAHPPP